MYRFVTHLEALTPGMKAKLDPNFRLSTVQNPEYATSIPRKDTDFPHSSPALQPVVKRNSFK
jgi:hypothetical protein